MEKEDIAAISRRENKNRNLTEIETVSRAGEHCRPCRRRCVLRLIEV